MSASLIQAIFSNNLKKVKNLLKSMKKHKADEEINQAIGVAFHCENDEIINTLLDMYYPEIQISN